MYEQQYIFNSECSLSELSPFIDEKLKISENKKKREICFTIVNCIVIGFFHSKSKSHVFRYRIIVLSILP